MFFFKQKTAYEMRISDWSSDVCSSDLCTVQIFPGEAGGWGIEVGNNRHVFRNRAQQRLRRGRLRIVSDAGMRAPGDRDSAFFRLQPDCRVSRPPRTRKLVFRNQHAIFDRSEEHTSELQSIMRKAYHGFCLKKKIINHKADLD